MSILARTGQHSAHFNRLKPLDMLFKHSSNIRCVILPRNQKFLNQADYIYGGKQNFTSVLRNAFNKQNFQLISINIKLLVSPHTLNGVYKEKKMARKKIVIIQYHILVQIMYIPNNHYCWNVFNTSNLNLRAIFVSQSSINL